LPSDLRLRSHYEEKYGKKILVFNGAPRVVVEEDTISKKWDIEVGVPK